MEVIIHHSEIALKGKNRPFFEKCLIENIKSFLIKNKIKFDYIKKDDARIICSLNDKNIELNKVFGIKDFCFAEESGNDIKEIIKKASEILKKIDIKKTIAVKTRRSDKKLAYTSMEISRKIGEIAYEKGFKIDLTNPDETLNIEITNEKAYFYTKKIKGYGGLPVGSSGKVLCLLSGGIDSCAASWLMMKRGCKVDYLHFHALKNNDEVKKTKIKKIFEILNDYGDNSKLFLIPYYNYQLAVMDKINDKNDVVIFRNFMLKIGEKLALKNGYKALITGDSLGQVASQTLDNLKAISYNVNIPILRPLIGYDKQEIIDLAKKIGTYEESIKEYKDCCSIISRKPSTSVKIEQLEKEISKINMDKLVEKEFKNIEKF